MLRQSLVRAVARQTGICASPSTNSFVLARSCTAVPSYKEFVKQIENGKGRPRWDYEPGSSNLPSTWPAKPCEFQNTSVVKDGESPRGPQAAYPEFKYHLPYDTSRYRLYFIPEAFFNFLHERTGVMGPYMLLWGGLVTLFSKEYLIINEEIGAALMWFIIPPYLAAKFGPKVDRSIRQVYNDRMLLVEKLKKSKEEQYTNEIEALQEDSTRADAGKEIFTAYSANIDNMIEAEFRQRQEQVYQAFKRRLDYQVAVQGLEEQLVQKQLVAYVKQEVAKALQAKSQKESIGQCLQQLKSLAAQGVSV